MDECEILTQIHHFGCRGLSVATIYGRGIITESQGKVREFLFPDLVGILKFVSHISYFVLHIHVQ